MTARHTMLTGIALAALGACGPQIVTRGDTVVIRHDGGGSIVAYDRSVRALTDSGATVRLEGQIESAATMFLAVPGACVDPDAVLAFHGAWPRHADSAVQAGLDWQMARHYPPVIQAIYMDAWRHHGPMSFHRIRGRDLAAIDPNVTLCGSLGMRVRFGMQPMGPAS